MRSHSRSLSGGLRWAPTLRLLSSNPSGSRMCPAGAPETTIEAGAPPPQLPEAGEEVSRWETQCRHRFRTPTTTRRAPKEARSSRHRLRGAVDPLGGLYRGPQSRWRVTLPPATSFQSLRDVHRSPFRGQSAPRRRPAAHSPVVPTAGPECLGRARYRTRRAAIATKPVPAPPPHIPRHFVHTNSIGRKATHQAWVGAHPAA